MIKRPMACYLVSTFVLSWLCWGIVLLGQELGWFQYGSLISMIPYIVGGNGPAIAVYCMLKRENPAYSIKAYMKEAFALRQPLAHYALMLLFLAISFGVPALMGGIAVEGPPVLGGTEGFKPLPLWLTVLGAPLFFFLGGSEELGWRHFLQPKLERKIPFIPAVLIVGVIWALWHLPLFFIVGTSQNASSFLSFSIMVMGSAFALAALHRVNGSAWLCVLLHCLSNSMSGTWPVSDGLMVNLCTAAVLCAVSLAVVSVQARLTSAKEKAAPFSAAGR